MKQQHTARYVHSATDGWLLASWLGVSEESKGFVGASVCAREALVDCWSYGINSALGWL
jgi:hypothetical protein